MSFIFGSQAYLRYKIDLERLSSPYVYIYFHEPVLFLCSSYPNIMGDTYNQRDITSKLSKGEQPVLLAIPKPYIGIECNKTALKIAIVFFKGL